MPVTKLKKIKCKRCKKRDVFTTENNVFCLECDITLFYKKDNKWYKAKYAIKE